MRAFTAIEGQSVWDVCLNTYGTFDNIVKLLQDNGIDNVNLYPFSGQMYYWDETLSADQNVNLVAASARILYATKALLNSHLLSSIQPGGGSYIKPVNDDTMIKYQQTTSTQYIATGGETTITLSELIGATIIQITHEIHPVATADFSFNPASGLITFASLILGAGEIVFIIYGKILLS